MGRVAVLVGLLSSQEIAVIDRLRGEGKTTRAIKELRLASNLSLIDAKYAIDNWTEVRRQSTPEGPVSAESNPTHLASKLGMSPDSIARISVLVREDRQIEAIKLLRTNTGLGLLDAKKLIDNWTQEV